MCRKVSKIRVDGDDSVSTTSTPHNATCIVRRRRRRGVVAPCRLAVSARPSVCPSVRLSRSCILSKLINLFSQFFHHRVATPYSSFSTPTVMAIFGRGPPNWGTNHDIPPIYGFVIDQCWTVECHQHFDGRV